MFDDIYLFGDYGYQLVFLVVCIYFQNDQIT